MNLIRQTVSKLFLDQPYKYFCIENRSSAFSVMQSIYWLDLNDLEVEYATKARISD